MIDKTSDHLLIRKMNSIHNNVARIALASITLGNVSFRTQAGAGLYMGPYFPSPSLNNITVHQETTAYLPCTVKQLGDKSVSWVRQRDADILTVDHYTFVRDERLTVHYTADTDTWTLVIKYVQERDAGTYECQISTEPKMSKLVHLNVIAPEVEITGDIDKYVQKGSTARLECIVTSTIQLPDYIFWYHSGERLLEYDHPRARISVSRRGGQGSEMSITSSLIITNAHAHDEGNYSCLPSNLHPAYAILHVLNDEHPAAMQTGAGILTDPPSVWGIMWFVFIAFVFVRVQQTVSLSSLYAYPNDTISVSPSPKYSRPYKAMASDETRSSSKGEMHNTPGSHKICCKTCLDWMAIPKIQTLKIHKEGRSPITPNDLKSCELKLVIISSPSKVLILKKRKLKGKYMLIFLNSCQTICVFSILNNSRKQLEDAVVRPIESYFIHHTKKYFPNVSQYDSDTARCLMCIFIGIFQVSECQEK